jgi:hypothetical protein
VSLATDGRLPGGDPFEIALSHDGLEIRRPGRETRRLSWARVSEWEVQDRPAGVLLTLRGRGAVTTLVVPGWTVDELEVALRDATAPSSTETTPEQTAGDLPVPPRAAAPAASESPAPGAGPHQEKRRARRARQGGHRFTPWKVVVTVALLAALVTAITLVLLESAGIIHLSILGPTA